MTYRPKNKKEHRLLVKFAESIGYYTRPKTYNRLGDNIRVCEYRSYQQGGIYLPYIIPNSVEAPLPITYLEFVNALVYYSPIRNKDLYIPY